jgi:hypothetical protein
MLTRDFLDDVEGLLREIPFQKPVYYAVEPREDKAMRRISAVKYYLVLTAHFVTEDQLYKAEALVGYVDELVDVREGRQRAVQKINTAVEKILEGLKAKVPNIIWKKGILRPGKATRKVQTS